MFVETKREGEAQTEHPLWSLRGLIAWLEMKPAETAYNWLSIDHCVVAQYLRDKTGKNNPAGAYSFDRLPKYFEVACELPWTFGAALARARAALAAAPTE